MATTAADLRLMRALYREGINAETIAVKFEEPLQFVWAVVSPRRRKRRQTAHQQRFARLCVDNPHQPLCVLVALWRRAMQERLTMEEARRWLAESA